MNKVKNGQNGKKRTENKAQLSKNPSKLFWLEDFFPHSTTYHTMFETENIFYSPSQTPTFMQPAGWNPYTYWEY